MQDRATNQSIYFWQDAVLMSRGDGENIRGLHAGCMRGVETGRKYVTRDSRGV